MNMFVTLEKKIKNLPPLVCDWQLPARRMFNAGWVGESANFHSLVVGTVTETNSNRYCGMGALFSWSPEADGTGLPQSKKRRA